MNDLRWQPPAPLEPWTDVRATKSYSKVCMQSNGIYNEVAGGMSEDCLFVYLSVDSHLGSVPVNVSGSFADGP